MPYDSIMITVVYDNNPCEPGLETAWGFSVLIEYSDKKILFDTGGEGELLLRNLEKLKIDPKKIDATFLSHTHGDHTGGLTSLHKINPEMKVIMPKSFPRFFKEDVKFQEISDFQELMPGIYSTGELGESIMEQSLVIRTKRGLVVITGCAHPGIVNIVSRVKAYTDEPIYLVLGGFHLLSLGKYAVERIASDLKALGVKKVGSCHCSGDRAMKIFEKEFGEDFVKIGVGWKEEISDGSTIE